MYNNQPLLDQFVLALQRDKMHHANLIASGAGEEGLPVALGVAQYILCESNSACGECKSCKQHNKLQHADLHFSFPFVSGSTNGIADDFLAEFRTAIAANPFIDPDSWQQRITSKNQQLQIPVKEIQNIHRKLSLTAASGKNRVLIIWMPEQIKTQASNKLLKLIEEPLPNTYLLLVTHRKSRLLPTIISRCAPWQCKPLEEKHFWEHFRGEDDATKRLMTMVFYPNLGAAITAHEDPETTQTGTFANWMRICYKGAPVEITDMVNVLSAMSKEGLKTLIFRSQHFLERGFYHNVQNTPVDATDLGTINVQKLSNAVVPEGALAIARALNECLYDLERNVHVKTTLTHTSYTLHRAFRGL